MSAARAPGEPKTTDLGNSKRFVDLYKDKIRYVHEWRWLAWDGRRWALDKTGQIERWAKETVDSIYKEALKVNGPERQELIKHAYRSESKARIRDMIELAKSEREIVARPEDFDQDPMLLNVNNGTLDLRTGKLRPQKQSDYLTKLAPVDYDAAAQAPLWTEFLSKVMDGNQNLIDFLKRFAGYCSTGETTEQSLLVLFGTGANGKSTFLQILEDMLGNYAQTMPPETLMMQRGDRIPNDIARLAGVRFAIAVESGVRRPLNESLVKQMTGGDRLTARFLHGEYFEFKPQFKPVLGTNHKPKISGQDLGIWRRIKLVPFTVTIPPKDQDKKLSEKLRRELPGILAWAVKGCLAWQKDGELTEPQEVKQATREYKTESDMLAEWIEECCDQGDSDSNQSTPTLLYGSYRNWCEVSGVKAMSKNKLGRLLKERELDSARTKQGRFWLGIAPKHF